MLHAAIPPLALSLLPSLLRLTRREIPRYTVSTGKDPDCPGRLAQLVRAPR